jgi:hypothetical protein
MQATTQPTRKRIADLKAGDIVRDHGALFRVDSDARESVSHRPQAAHLEQAHGPSCCAVAAATCIYGEIAGYFRPGSSWTFQGASWVLVSVIS